MASSTVLGFIFQLPAYRTNGQRVSAEYDSSAAPQNRKGTHDKGGSGHHGCSDEARTLGGAEPNLSRSSDALALAIADREDARRGKGLGKPDGSGRKNETGPAEGRAGLKRSKWVHGGIIHANPLPSPPL